MAIMTTARMTAAAVMRPPVRWRPKRTEAVWSPVWSYSSLMVAGLELVLAHEGAERDAYIQELKNVVLRYLEPLVGDRSAAGPASVTAH